ncbi:type VI secretion system contractile sheath large subunit [Halomonas sp. THAF12]|uniref:type VI secretion system contractile sheath large subunit n=1 Tax=Halomonas sp. B23F22_10 TaxID=3459515 RepID=UPI00373F2618
MTESTQTQAQSAKNTETEDVSLLDQVMAQTRMAPADEGYDVAKQGVAAFIGELLKSDDGQQQVNKSVVDRMIVELDRKIGHQVDEILHDQQFQHLESAWRGLKLLVDRTDFRENIKLNVLHATKEELLDDFEFAPEISQSGLYQHVYAAEYGQFGGEPVAAMIGHYDFTPSTPDIKLLQYTASVGAMSHAPFLSSVAPSFFGIDSFEELPNIKDFKAIFEGPKYARWRSLRESEDARYLGLTAPRFLLRMPYDPVENPVKSFHYEESVSESHDHYLWGNTAYLLAERLNDSFAKYRWCPNIIGPQSGGAVENLPVHTYEALGQLQSKIPTEVLITDRREFEMAEEGFISLTMRKGSDNAAFFSANSVQKPKSFPNTPEGREAETNYKLGTQLPYMFIVNRLAHYIKVLQREQIGSWKERQDLERELNTWIRQYVADQENPPADVRSRRPLRAASVQVSDVEGDPGWYQVSLAVRPHFKYMGANFELSLVGRLDKD